MRCWKRWLLGRGRMRVRGRWRRVGLGCPFGRWCGGRRKRVRVEIGISEEVVGFDGFSRRGRRMREAEFEKIVMKINPTIKPSPAKRTYLIVQPLNTSKYPQPNVSQEKYFLVPYQSRIQSTYDSAPSFPRVPDRAVSSRHPTDRAGQFHPRDEHAPMHRRQLRPHD